MKIKYSIFIFAFLLTACGNDGYFEDKLSSCKSLSNAIENKDESVKEKADACQSSLLIDIYAGYKNDPSKYFLQKNGDYCPDVSKELKSKIDMYFEMLEKLNKNDVKTYQKLGLSLTCGVK